MPPIDSGGLFTCRRPSFFLLNFFSVRTWHLELAAEKPSSGLWDKLPVHPLPLAGPSYWHGAGVWLIHNHQIQTLYRALHGGRPLFSGADDGRLPIRPRFRRVCAYTHSFTWNWRQSGNSRLGLAQREKKEKKRALTREKQKKIPPKSTKTPHYSTKTQKTHT